MEFPTWETFAWLAQCAIGKEKPTREEAEKYRQWMEDKIFLVTADQGFTVDECVETFTWLRAVKGCRFFLIDSLTTFDDVDETDLKEQIRAIKILKKLPAALQAHIILITHFGKQAKDKNGNLIRQDRSSIRGASAIKDLAHTVMVLNRDPDKKAALREVYKVHPPGDTRDQLRQQIWESCPDAVLSVDTHRKDGASTPDFNLWWHSCRQYTSKPAAELLIPYVNL